MSEKKQAVLYRMVTDQHICPYGIKSKDLLEKKGYAVEDHHLKSRTEADTFKAQHSVETTPQTFIEQRRIGGYSDLLAYFGKQKKEDAVTYKPVLYLFATAFLMALALGAQITGAFFSGRTLELFIALSMCLLAVLKLRDLEAFSMQFITYDLLAQKKVGYSYFYPFAEAAAGIGMLSMTLGRLVAPVALFIGTVGAVSVIKAVYIDKRKLKCACVGGGSNVPLGFISLTENLMMAGMAVWMFFK